MKPFKYSQVENVFSIFLGVCITIVTFLNAPLPLLLPIYAPIGHKLSTAIDILLTIGSTIRGAKSWSLYHELVLKRNQYQIFPSKGHNRKQVKYYSALKLFHPQVSLFPLLFWMLAIVANTLVFQFDDELGYFYSSLSNTTTVVLFNGTLNLNNTSYNTSSITFQNLRTDFLISNATRIIDSYVGIDMVPISSFSPTHVNLWRIGQYLRVICIGGAWLSELYIQRWIKRRSG
jgi:hypothetical protein